MSRVTFFPSSFFKKMNKERYLMPTCERRSSWTDSGRRGRRSSLAAGPRIAARRETDQYQRSIHNCSAIVLHNSYFSRAENAGAQTEGHRKAKASQVRQKSSTEKCLWFISDMHFYIFTSTCRKFPSFNFSKVTKQFPYTLEMTASIHTLTTE